MVYLFHTNVKGRYKGSDGIWSGHYLLCFMHKASGSDVAIPWPATHVSSTWSCTAVTTASLGACVHTFTAGCRRVTDSSASVHLCLRSPLSEWRGT